MQRGIGSRHRMNAPSLAVGADLNGISLRPASPDPSAVQSSQHATGELDATMRRDGHGRRCQSAGWVHTHTGARAAHSLGGWSHPRCQWFGLKRVARARPHAQVQLTSKRAPQKRPATAEDGLHGSQRRQCMPAHAPHRQRPAGSATRNSRRSNAWCRLI